MYTCIYLARAMLSSALWMIFPLSSTMCTLYFVFLITTPNSFNFLELLPLKGGKAGGGFNTLTLIPTGYFHSSVFAGTPFFALTSLSLMASSSSPRVSCCFRERFFISIRSSSTDLGMFREDSWMSLSCRQVLLQPFTEGILCGVCNYHAVLCMYQPKHNVA